MIERLIRLAQDEERQVLLEHELLPALAEQGLPTPRACVLPRASLADDAAVDAELDAAGLGPKLVLKVVSPAILHKSDVGGVAFVERSAGGAAAAREMIERLPPELAEQVEGVLAVEAVPYVAGLGRELLLGMRRSRDFGVVYTIGFGGTYVEALAAATRDDQSTVLYAPHTTSAAQLRHKLERSLFFRWATGGVRGVEAICEAEALHRQLERWVAALEALRQRLEETGREVLELELNPLVWSGESWLPVDALARLGEAPTPAPSFPLAQLRSAVRPSSVALIGVSTKMNMGRIILRSILDAGFPAERARVVREGVEEIDGVRCVPRVDALAGAVDLLVVAVAAAGVPEVLEQACRSGKVRSVLLIPGGMGETEGGKGIERQVLDLLAAQPPATRPVLVGNNSLGIVSRPARFDSFFIPEDKLPRVEQGKTLHRVAFISQSGAFMLTQLGKHQFVRPDYQVSIGNQIDARASHFVEALAEERELRTFALYVEGLKPGDGERLARVVRDVARERDVIVYKAGRSSLGQAATMGHTASIAGDYRVFRDVLADAGALVAESFAEFYDLVGLSAALGDKRFGGGRVALLSNAGYEVVGMADNHRGSRYALEPAQLAPETVTSIEQALEKARIAALINVKNPLDLTPMANDEVHDACARALLADPGVDLAVLGNVPFTPAVQSLPHGVSERDVFDAEGSYANRMVELFGSSDKPFVVVIDAGGYYDPMCDHMRAAGVPVFRDADRATRALGRYAALRLRQQGA